MIDPTDNATQQLPLEPTKRGRGRPATGKAMTPAEKQKAYRDRQKAAAGNVTENTSTRETGSIELLRERALSRGRTCVQQARMLVEAEKRISALEELLAKRSERRLPEGIEQINAELVKKVERLERELAAEKKAKPSPLDAAKELIQYQAQRWEKTKRKWETIGGEQAENRPFDNWREAEKFVKEIAGMNPSKFKYRIVPANLPVNEYR